MALSIVGKWLVDIYEQDHAKDYILTLLGDSKTAIDIYNLILTAVKIVAGEVLHTCSCIFWQLSVVIFL